MISERRGLSNEPILSRSTKGKERKQKGQQTEEEREEGMGSMQTMQLALSDVSSGRPDHSSFVFLREKLASPGRQGESKEHDLDDIYCSLNHRLSLLGFHHGVCVNLGLAERNKGANRQDLGDGQKGISDTTTCSFRFILLSTLLCSLHIVSNRNLAQQSLSHTCISHPRSLAAIRTSRSRRPTRMKYRQ
jgi:hypothetical protein